jgi:hypothetical protein
MTKPYKKEEKTYKKIREKRNKKYDSWMKATEYLKM